MTAPERPDADLWERSAQWWQDEFTAGADIEYTEQILPLISARLAGATRVLDVGTGEGQVSRMLAEQGMSVTGIDPTQAQIVEAARRGGGPSYVRSAAASLPFADGAFDAALACLVFEHIDDVDGAIADLARVLQPGGRFLFLLNHPLLQTPNSGWIDDQVLEPPEQYWRIGPYLTEAESIEEVQKDVHIRFVHRPLSRYVNTLAAHGLVVAHMDEPAPPDGFVALAPEYPDAATIPRLLGLLCVRTGRP